jgi:hypothetical protein
METDYAFVQDSAEQMKIHFRRIYNAPVKVTVDLTKLPN